MTPENTVDTSTCWYNDSVIDEMNRFYDLHRNNPETSWHFENFKVLLDKIPIDGGLFSPLLYDIGCGSGQLQDFTKGYQYIGVDMQHIVEGCLLRNYPECRSICRDIINTDAAYLSHADLVVMNGVIDIMQYPIEMIGKILDHAKRYVIIHRQEITENGDTQSIKKGSYGGETYHSIINRNKFRFFIEYKGFQIIAEEKLKFLDWENGGSSFLLKKLTA